VSSRPLNTQTVHPEANVYHVTEEFGIERTGSKKKYEIVRLAYAKNSIQPYPGHPEYMSGSRGKEMLKQAQHD
jgi:hypothetical protein